MGTSAMTFGSKVMSGRRKKTTATYHAREMWPTSLLNQILKLRRGSPYLRSTLCGTQD